MPHRCRLPAFDNLALVALVLAALAACAAPQTPPEECEPGVNEISDVASLVPGNC